MLKKMVLCLLLCSCMMTSYANDSDILKSAIAQLQKETDANINAGIIIEDLTTNTILYQQNAERNYVPASNLKLFTAISALLYFHPHHRFKTELLTTGKIKRNGDLTSDLYVRFSGTPDLSASDLAALLTRMRLLGIHRIKGNIFIDNNSFSKQAMGPGWMWDDAAYCFSAPVDSIIINHNCFQVYLHHGKWKNNRVAAISDNNYMEVTSENLRFKHNTKNCKLTIKSNQRNQYQLSGCVPWETKSLDLAIQHPEHYAKAFIQSTLKEANIHHTGHILFKKSPKDAHVITAQTSLPVRELITTMLKESDNLYADAIFKLLAHDETNTPVTWKVAALARNEILQKQAKLDTNRLSLIDGSGLSRYNLITPLSLSALLKTAYNEFSISAELLAALPVNGKDGTLIHRLKEKDLNEQVRAKTGSMAHVSSLAGFLQTRNHHILSFVILVNGIQGSLDPYRAMEDHIVAFLARLSPDTHVG